MSIDKKELAKIESTFLGFEDHGILTAYVNVNYGSASQGIGGYDLRDKAGPFIDRLLKACGVTSWEKLVGRTIYVLSEGGRVVGICPLPTEPGTAFIFSEVMGRPE